MINICYRRLSGEIDTRYFPSTKRPSFSWEVDEINRLWLYVLFSSKIHKDLCVPSYNRGCRTELSVSIRKLVCLQIALVLSIFVEVRSLLLFSYLNKRILFF